MPHGLIMVYEMGRVGTYGMERVPVPPISAVMDFATTAANIMHPCRVIGISVNGRKYTDAEVAEECRRVEDEFGLPACDIFRHGPDKLVDAVLRFRDEIPSM
jgi:uncharacterized NAD-dependent epimerase/dehydratase family protein